MEFKHPHLDQELHQCASQLVAILFWVDWYCQREFGKPLVITDLLRPDDPGVHGAGRGGDGRVCMNYGTEYEEWHLTHEQAVQVRDEVNRLWTYDPTRTWLKVCVFDMKGGHKDHFHFQVHQETKTGELYLDAV